MTKLPTLSDKELKKWTGILGHEKILRLYMDYKIRLSSAQLDKLIEEKNTLKEEQEKFKDRGVTFGKSVD